MTKPKKKPELVQKWEKEAEEQARKPSPLTEFERKAELEKKLDNLVPTNLPEVPFKGKGINKLKISYAEQNEKGETQLTQIEQPQAEKTVYKIQKNPFLIFLMNIANSKIYFDTRTSEYYQYVFQPDRKKIHRKMKLEKHDILNLGIFFLWRILKEKPLKWNTRIFLNKKIRKKIAQLRRKEDQFYGEPKI